MFNGLLEELNELLGATPEPPAEGKKPLQIHRVMMLTRAILRCAYCRLGKSVKDNETVRMAGQADSFHSHLAFALWGRKVTVMKTTDSDLSNDEGARITEFIPEKRQSCHEKHREELV